MKNKITLVLNRSEFIGWRFSSSGDFQSFEEDVISGLEKQGKFTFTIEKLAQETGYIPLDIIKNKQAIPQTSLDEEKTELVDPENYNYKFE